jgi:hypothetical protein
MKGETTEIVAKYDQVSVNPVDKEKDESESTLMNENAASLSQVFYHSSLYGMLFELLCIIDVWLC